jgi:2-dehydro-3-deoxyphosphogluconate aldolase / (4S)-4-hydroxy-2-oxoglutarate aldolase
MVVAAGTVLSARQMADAAEAGADFAVSPGATPALFEAALSMQFPYLPGVATATEAMAAAEAGFDVLKFFPAQAAGGIAMLKGLADPLPHLRFCPTGGVSLANLADWLGLPNVVCAGGTWIATRQALGRGGLARHHDPRRRRPRRGARASWNLRAPAAILT